MSITVDKPKKSGIGFKRIPLSFNRRAVIASASVTGRRNVFHSFSEVDISIPRKLINKKHVQNGEKLSLTAYIVACLADTLKYFPMLNSFIRRRKLMVLDEITISVLIEKDDEGEKVPEPIGIRNAGAKSYYLINQELEEAKTNRKGKLGSLSGQTWIRLIPAIFLKLFIRLADKNIKMALKYGKVAVTAVGMFSKEPVWFIPHGTATILATIGSISKKVIDCEGKHEQREHLCLTLSFDHNIVDGAPAARFTSQFIETVKSGKLLSNLE